MRIVPLPVVLSLLVVFTTETFAGLIGTGPWTGGVTSHGAVVMVRLKSHRLAYLEISDDAAFIRPISVAESTKQEGDLPEIARFHIQGLQPNTKYYYRIRAGVERDTFRPGAFTTFPRAGEPASFRFAFASCAATGSEAPVFAEIRYQNPLFYLITGDLHYEDIALNDRTLFRAAYERVLGSTVQGNLYRSVPIVYTWDDHDFGPNGSDRTSPSLEASHATYREYVPHYPLASAPRPQGPIAQAFSVGRVRFLVLDTRTARDPEDAPDNAEKTMLGAWQKEWLKTELLAASGRYPLIFIVSSVAWISDETDKRDNWGRYATERAELSDWMVAQGIRGVCFLGGDAHMLAADDGSHNRYAKNGGPGFPALQAAPLDRAGSIKGGPWSVAPVLPGKNEGQFGLVTVTDSGNDRIEVLFRGLNHNGQEKLRFGFSVPAH
jgi:phosphodiesterase/alkaline phosphatase D-like protein